jgi:hypothetical protein
VNMPSVASADPTHSGVFVLHGGGQFQPPIPRAQRPIRIVPLMLVTTLLAVAANAMVVADTERAACAAARECNARPATWRDATLWLLSRTSFQDSEFVPATWQAQFFGLVMPLLGVVVILCLGIAGWRYARYSRASRVLRYQHIRQTFEEAMSILLLVVLDIERDTVVDEVTAASGSSAMWDTARGYPIFRLGRLGRAEIVLAQACRRHRDPGVDDVGR